MTRRILKHREERAMFVEVDAGIHQARMPGEVSGCTDQLSELPTPYCRADPTS